MKRLVLLAACATAALLAGCGSGASRHAASAGASHGGLPELTSIS